MVDESRDVREWNPLDHARLLRVGRRAGAIGAAGEVDLVRSVDHSRHRLVSGKPLERAARLPAGLLQRLPSRSHRAAFISIDDAARQLPAPLICREPVSLQHEYPVLFVDDHGHRHPAKPNDVMPPTVPVWRLDIGLNEPNPPVVVHHAFAMNLPPELVRTLC